MKRNIYAGKEAWISQKAARDPKEHLEHKPGEVQDCAGIVAWAATLGHQQDIPRHATGHARTGERFGERAFRREKTGPRDDDCQRNKQQCRREAVDKPVNGARDFRS